MQEIPAAEETTALHDQIDALNARAWELSRTATNEASTPASQALGLAEKENYTTGIAEALVVLGLINFLKGRYAEALQQSERALALAETIGDRSIQSRALNNIGSVYKSTSDYAKALEFYTRSLSINEETGNKHGVATILGNIGIVYKNTAEYSKALEYYSRSLIMKEEIGDKPGIANAFGNIGNVYGDTADYSKALEYQMRALAIHEENGDRYGAAHAMANIGNVYSATADYTKAMEYQLLALATCEETGDKYGAANCLNNIGNIYLETADYSKALEYQMRSLAIKEEAGDKGGVAVSLLNIGNVYFSKAEYSKGLESTMRSLVIFEEVGDKYGMVISLVNIGSAYAKKDFSGYDSGKSIEYLGRALTLAEEIGAKKPVFEAHKGLAEVYRDTGDIAKAYEHLAKYHETEKEVLNEETTKKIQNLEAQRKFAEIEKEREIERLKNTELATAFKNLKEAEMQLIHAEKMSSLGQLTAGIAHEINNPVNFISGNVNPLKRDIDDILKLIELQDKIISGNNLTDVFKESGLFKNEIDFSFLKGEIEELLKGIETGARRTAEIVKGLKTFSRLDENEKKLADVHEGIDSTLVLLNSQLGDKNITVFKNYGELPLIECYPGQLNQVFMNILSNGIQAMEYNGEIHIATKLLKEKVCISIRDTGAGMSQEVLKKIFEPFFTTKAIGEGTGLGLSIAYSIIEKHGGSISLESEPGKGTEFTIELPA